MESRNKKKDSFSEKVKMVKSRYIGQLKNKFRENKNT